MTESQMMLDLSPLPEQARTELFDFYEFLSQKYKFVPSEIAETSVMGREQSSDKNDHRSDFTDLFGVWSESDLREFCSAVEEFDVIDPEDWR